MTPLIILCVLGVLLATTVYSLGKAWEQIRKVENVSLEVKMTDLRRCFTDNEISFLKKKLSLLESHLNLTYIPEGKSEARYEEKSDALIGGYHSGFVINSITPGTSKSCPTCTETLKTYTGHGGMGYKDSNGVDHAFGHGEGVQVSSVNAGSNTSTKFAGDAGGRGVGKITKTKKK